MIPIQLIIEGIYSYQQRQTIDFTELTDAGLFGVFGAVGSGKSTLLEAMSFALYGETVRMNLRDKRSYNMMNLKSNRMYIQFDFLNFENKKFRVTREFRRNSKRFEDVKLESAVFYEFINEQWLPLNHLNASEILGLSYDNFKRTIIIPQNQFREFIELGATERTKMMKEIFGLHRFDLQDKTGILRSRTKSELDQLNGKLEGFEEVNSAILEEKKKQLKLAEDKLNKVQTEFDENQKIFKKLELLKLDFESLKSKKIEFESLKNQKNKYDLKLKEVEEYELIFNAFDSILKDQKKTEEEKKELKEKLKSEKEELKKIKEQKEAFNSQLKKIQPEYEALDESKKKADDLELIAKILDLKKEVESYKKRSQKGREMFLQKEKENKGLKNEIEKTDELIVESQKKIISSSVLTAVGSWFSELNLKKEYLEKRKNNLKEGELKLKNIQEKISKKGVEAQDIRKAIHQENETIKLKKKELEKQKSQLEIQQKMTEYAHALSEGQACPLCGSLEHPNISEHQDVAKKLESICVEIQEIEQELDKNQKQLVDLDLQLVEQKNAENQIQIEKNYLKELEKEIQEHGEKFCWNDFKVDDFEYFVSKKVQNEAIESEIKKLNTHLRQLRDKKEIVNKDLEIYTTTLNEIKEKELVCNTKIKQNKVSLRILKWDDFLEEEVTSVQEKAAQLLEKIKKLDKEFHQIQSNLNELNPKISARETAVEMYGNNLEKCKNNLLKIQNLIWEKMKEFSLDSLVSIKEVLSKNLSSNEIRKEVQDFMVAFETVKNTILELEKKLEKVSFHEEEFKIVQQNLESKTAELEENKTIVVLQKSDLERLTNLYASKKILLKEKSELEKRYSNLDLLFNLFKGQGFVNYISSIYLQSLCEQANQRFHRMTRNQLSLVLNESNDFEVIDYLNEGKSRSVKTLSGGQSFQVSLSLALALAESVQSDAKANRKFFFIDEGFGTQDLDSVNLIFETLMSLYKENRIVGIISHVEELKEKIPISLQIVNEAEKGSQILKSY